ncbi:MAG: nucleoside hydrolase [Calditrichaeota bacterium]|nr:MAG: nucleoside hydrolase [Calditrichota bacterium]
MLKISKISALIFFFSCSLAAQNKQKIIFDCDIGGAIDDAYAIALLLCSPEFEILGIITDYGDTGKRAQVACRLLYETGRDDIPVIVGRETGSDYDNQFRWADGFNKISPQKISAADFIIENLKKYPGEIILFTVGPVPNIADVLQKDPDVLKLAKRVVSMFGSFYMGYDGGSKPDAEWNVQVDVASSKMLVASGARLTFAGLDITTFVRFNQSQLLRLLMRQSPLTNSLSSLYSLWQFEDYAEPDPALFDVVAVGMVLWPELFETKSVHVSVQDDGFTVVDEERAPNAEIGVKINENVFIERVMERLIKQNLGRN